MKRTSHFIWRHHVKDGFCKPGHPENEDGEWVTGVNRGEETGLWKKTKPVHVKMTRQCENDGELVEGCYGKSPGWMNKAKMATMFLCEHQDSNWTLQLMAHAQRDMESADNARLILVTKLKYLFETSRANQEEWRRRVPQLTSGYAIGKWWKQGLEGRYWK